MKMLEEKEVELVERAKEANRWSQKESDLQARLQRANDLFLQGDQELEVESQKSKRVTREKEDGERAL